MVIPLVYEFFAVHVDHTEEKFNNKPQVVGVISVEGIEALEPQKETPPIPAKVSANLNPKAFYAGIVCGTVVRL